jgi:hypothetical protein
MATSIGREKLELSGKQFAYCDEIAISVAIAPEKIIKESKMLRGSVELQGQYTRLKHKIWSRHQKLQPNVEIY